MNLKGLPQLQMSSVNHDLLNLYWDIAAQIVEK